MQQYAPTFLNKSKTIRLLHRKQFITENNYLLEPEKYAQGAYLKLEGRNGVEYKYQIIEREFIEGCGVTLTLAFAKHRSGSM